jgi:hypothetical protein
VTSHYSIHNSGAREKDLALGGAYIVLNSENNWQDHAIGRHAMGGDVVWECHWLVFGGQ